MGNRYTSNNHSAIKNCDTLPRRRAILVRKKRRLIWRQAQIAMGGNARALLAYLNQLSATIPKVHPTDMTVVSADEATGMGRFSISCDGTKGHHQVLSTASIQLQRNSSFNRAHATQEQVVTFATPAELSRFISSVKMLAATSPPAHTRASRMVCTSNLLLKSGWECGF